MSWSWRALLGLATLGVAVLLVVMAMVQAGQSPWRKDNASRKTFEARVVRFGGVPSKWRPGKIIVVASTVDGRTGQGVMTTALRDQLNCKVGDPISAHMVGVVMVVDPQTCNQSLR